MDKIIDWEQRRYEIALRMAAAIVSNPDEMKTVWRLKGEPTDIVAKLAVEYADAIIENLK